MNALVFHVKMKPTVETWSTAMNACVRLDILVSTVKQVSRDEISLFFFLLLFFFYICDRKLEGFM